MWPFDRTKTAAAPGGTTRGAGGTDPAAARASTDANADAIAKLNKRLDAIEMEWMEWFDKFRRLYARLAKRQEREAAEEENKSSEDAPGREIDIQPVSGGPVPRARRNY